MARSEKTKLEITSPDGKNYTLELTAGALKKAERMGIKFGDLSQMPFTAPETIFWIAFFKNHPAVSQKEATKIFRGMKLTADNMEKEYDEDGNEVDALTAALIEMLGEAVEELNSRQGNGSWKMI